MKLIKFIFLFYFLMNVSYANEVKNKIDNFFKSFDTIQAEFVQYSNFEDKNLTKGLFYIDRPGKLRFEYHSPFKSLLINNGKLTHYYDIDLDELTSIPSSKTPLSFLLQKHNSIEEMNFIVENIEEKDDKIFLTVISLSVPITLQLQLFKIAFVYPPAPKVPSNITSPSFGCNISRTSFNITDICGVSIIFCTYFFLKINKFLSIS